MTIPMTPTLEDRLERAIEFARGTELASNQTADANALVAAAYDTLRGVHAGTITLDDPMEFASALDRLATMAREVVVARYTQDISLAQRQHGVHSA